MPDEDLDLPAFQVGYRRQGMDSVQLVVHWATEMPEPMVDEVEVELEKQLIRQPATPASFNVAIAVVKAFVRRAISAGRLWFDGNAWHWRSFH